MKQSFSILAAGLVAVHAMPQNGGGSPASGLPGCASTCVSNLISAATSDPLFGCTTNNLTQCACCNPNFTYGIRDCSRDTCGGENADYSSAISAGSSYCASAFSACPNSAAASGFSSATGSGSGASSATSTGSGGGASALAPLGAIGGIRPVSGASNEYAIGSATTISAGGDALQTGPASFTALSSGDGVLVNYQSITTTIAASLLSEAFGASASGSGGLGAAASMVSAVSGSPGVYVVAGSNTISAGGDAYSTDSTVYTALSSGSGVSISGGGSATTAAGGMGGGLGAAASMISAVSGTADEYVVASSNTISAGGDAYSTDGTVYTALPSGSGVSVSESDGQTTVAESAIAGASGMTSSSSSGSDSGSSSTSGSGGSSTSSSGSGSASTESGSSGSSSSSSGIAPMATAAPALAGAALMAILAL